MRLLFVGGWGGRPVERHHEAPDLTVRLHQGLANRFDLSLALLGPIKAASGRLLPANSEVVYLPPYTTKRRYVGVRSEIRRVLREAVVGADLVVARIPSFHGVDAVSVASRLSVPCVCLTVGIWEETIDQPSGFKRVLFSRLARSLTYRAGRRASLVLAQGSHLASYLSGLGLKSETVIESTLEPEDFVDPTPDRLIRSKLKVLTISRLVRSKNLESLIDATRLLLRRGIECEVAIVGGGPQKAALEGRVVQQGLEGSVRLLGKVEDRQAIRTLISSSDVFVLPSVTEGISYSVMEAMAGGLPVIAAQVGGLGDILRPGINAVLVEKPTPKQLSGALESLAGDRKMALRLGDQAREDARALLHEAWVMRFEQLIASKLPTLGAG